jgi:hypothetical protein
MKGHFVITLFPSRRPRVRVLAPRLTLRDGASLVPSAGALVLARLALRFEPHLVLTDLLANPEPGKVNRLLLLLLKSTGGIAPPYGGVSRDLRLNFTCQHRHELEAAVQTMLSWEPERINFAHGRWHDANGTTELRNAFRWL